MTQEPAPTACVVRELPLLADSGCRRHRHIPGILRFLPTYLAMDSNHPRY